ncbi:hypothetical protein D3C71_2004080 [compost metagenome]
MSYCIGFDWLAPLRQLAQCRYVHIAKGCYRQSSRNGRCCHRQHIRIHSFATQNTPLINTETMLLVGYNEPQLAEKYILLD